MDNRAGEMEVFVEAVQQGSFAAAGRRLNLSPSAISKLVSRIEARLGLRLLMRSTRALQLTPEGEVYFQRAQRIVEDIGTVERMVSSGAAVVPRGLLRVNASVGVGARYVEPVVPSFLKRYPEIKLDLSLSDSTIDLIAERADVAIRTGPMRDSDLKARKLGESRVVVVAAPHYLATHGSPKTPHDLQSHNCLAFNFRRSLDRWPFRLDAGEVEHLSIAGNCLANNGATVKQLAVAGLGIARLGLFHVQDEIEAGRLHVILDDFNPGDIETIQAVYIPHPHLAARVRAFIEFLADHMAAVDRSAR